MPIKAIQQLMLGTVLNNERQAAQTLQAVKAAGYDGIELCRFMLHPAGLLVKMLTKAAGMPVGRGGALDWPALVRQADLCAVSLHADLGAVERDAAAVAAEANGYGTPYVVITGMYRFPYADAAAVRALAQRLNQAGQALRQEGVRLLYHNHNSELLRTGCGLRAYELLLNETDPALVNFEFDSYWFAEAGADPLAWMRRLGPRMKLWHINDRGARARGACLTPIVKNDSIELGDGNLELAALAQQAGSVGVHAVILESHRNWVEQSPIKSMQRSAAFLSQLPW